MGIFVMMKEISEQIKNEKISHVILQAGVRMAFTMVAGIEYLEYVPKIIIVEPKACVLERKRKD